MRSGHNKIKNFPIAPCGNRMLFSLTHFFFTTFLIPAEDEARPVKRLFLPSFLRAPFCQGLTFFFPNTLFHCHAFKKIVIRRALFFLSNRTDINILITRRYELSCPAEKKYALTTLYCFRFHTG